MSKQPAILTAFGLLTLIPLHTALAAVGTDNAAPLSLIPSLTLMIQLGVLVIAARLGGALFKRWGLLRSAGEVTAGIIIGPHLFGGVHLPGAASGIMSGITAILDTGHPLFGIVLAALTLLLFQVGLGTDVNLLRRYLGTSLMVGLGGSLASFAAVCAVAALALPMLSGNGCTFQWYEPFPFMAAVAVGVTSIGLLARMLTDNRCSETPEGVVALAGTITDTMAGVLLLATATQMMEIADTGAALSPASVAIAMLRALLLAALLAIAGTMAARRIERRQIHGRNRERILAITAICVLAAAAITGFGGASPLLGAYVMGVVFSATDMRHHLQEHLEFVHVALVPACFALIGAAVNLNIFASPLAWGFVLAIIITALLAKLIGSGLAARAVGLNWTGAWRVGILSMPRGELALAFSILGVAGGVLPEAMAAAVVLLVVCGVFLPGAACAALCRGGQGSRREFIAAEQVRLAFSMASADGALLVVRRIIDILEDDGFSVHVLNRRDRIFRFARDRYVITLCQEDAEVVFTCTPRERNLVTTVMVEVAAGIEQNLREVRRALDPQLLRRQTMAQQASGSATRATAEVLRMAIMPENMRPRLLADTKAGAIEELLDLLHENNLVSDRHEAGRAVFAREQSLSTGLEHGIAIPHGRTDTVDRLVCAIGLRREGIDFESMDSQPARIIILVLAPQGAAAPQLQFISMISQTLNEQGRAAILTCDSAEEMYATLTTDLAGVPRKEKTASALSCLHWQNVALDIGTGGKEDIIDRLLALCIRSGAVTSPEDARAAILARERKMSTGMEHGVALPHARTEAVSRLVCAVGVSREGVDFDSIDGMPTRIFVMTLIPPSVSTDYTRLAGAVMRALDREGRAAIFTAKSAQEVLEILARGEL